MIGFLVVLYRFDSTGVHSYIYHYPLINWIYKNQNTRKQAWKYLPIMKHGSSHSPNNLIQYVQYTKGRGSMDKWQSVGHKESYELRGKRNKPPVIIFWDKCCAEGYIKWHEITQAQGNNSVFRECGGGLRKIPQRQWDLSQTPRRISSMAQEFFWHISMNLAGHFSPLCLRFFINQGIHSKSCV